MQEDIIVIGAGASGMMAAITAAVNGGQVLILEQLSQPGKKLYATGNGKLYKPVSGDGMLSGRGSLIY